MTRGHPSEAAAPPYGGVLRPSARLQPTPPGWTELDRLVATERIRQTKSLYCFCMDSKDWDGFEAVFAADAVLEVPTGAAGEALHRVEGRGAVRRFVEEVVSGVATVHQCHTPVVEFESADAARVAWPMEDMLRFPEGSGMRTLHGMGHYFERYRRDGELWLISHVLLARLRLETT